MRKSYRKRFVLSNMLLAGSVLLIVFIVLGVTQVQSAYKEMNITMLQVLDQLDEPNERFRSLGEKGTGTVNQTPPEKPTGPKPENADGTPPEKPDETHDARKTDRNSLFGRKSTLSVDRNKIITVFYDTETQSISIAKSVKETDDTIIDKAVNEILAQDASSGRISSGLIYYKQAAEGGWKIALTNESDFELQILRLFLLFALGFLLAMGLLLLISIWLSKLAAKPMENAMQMQRQFVDNVSHDLKTPITVILANNSIMKGNPDETVASQKQWLDATDDAAKNMMHMINEMLSLSSLESPERHVNVVPVDLTGAAEKSVLQMESVAFDRGIVLEDEIAENVTALATTEFAERICNSLLENALKYEPDGGRVRVSLQTQKKQAVFTVQNFGSHISEEELPHIFERFYRSDKVRASSDGHGLGLPIVKQITTLIGASVTAKSSEKEGTVFCVSFALGGTAAKNLQ